MKKLIILATAAVFSVGAVAQDRDLDCSSYTDPSTGGGMGGDDDFGMGSSTGSSMKALCDLIVGVNQQVTALRNLVVAQQQSLNQLNQSVATLQANANTGSSNQTPACQGGDLAVRRSGSNHCYIGFNAQVNFENAAKSCTDLGGYLVTITSNDENDFVVKNFAPRDQAGNGKEVWIGFTDRRFESENTKNINKWEWVNGEVQINGDSIFNRFSSGEPNNGNNNEDCAVIHASRGGQWDDKECSEKRAYVCERDR